MIVITCITLISMAIIIPYFIAIINGDKSPTPCIAMARTCMKSIVPCSETVYQVLHYHDNSRLSPTWIHSFMSVLIAAKEHHKPALPFISIPIAAELYTRAP